MGWILMLFGLATAFLGGFVIFNAASSKVTPDAQYATGLATLIVGCIMAVLPYLASAGGLR